MANYVTGIGGFFFRSQDSKALAAWYEQHLGISSMASGQLWRQEPGVTVFAPFKQNSEYFPAEQAFMLNLRVSNLDALLAHLRAADIRIDEKQQEEEFGKFAWIYDPEGNKIELWEPKEE